MRVGYGPIINTNAPANKLSSSQKELKEVAQQFESLFIDMLFKEMRKSVSDSDLFGDRDAENTFQEMLDTQMSTKLSQSGGIGLGNVIYQQLVNYVPNND